MVDPLNKSIEELEKTLGNSLRAFREAVAAHGRPWLKIPRVFSNANDDLDSDASPDSFVGARLRPRRPLGGLAVSLPEPDEDLTAEAVGVRSRR
jgi:hypothetical protein